MDNMSNTDKNTSRTNFNDEFVAIYANSDVHDVNHQINKSCKVIKFTSECGLNKILSFIPKLNEYPNLFIFVIEVESLEVKEERIQTISGFLQDSHRPIILQIVSKKDEVIAFYFKKANEKQFKEVKVTHDVNKIFNNFESFLNCFVTENVEDYEDEIIEMLPKADNSTLILRFLRTLDLSNNLYMNLIYNCAVEGSKDDFLASLDAPMEGEGRFINPEAEDYLCETLVEADGKTTSVLLAAVQNSNEDVVNYLISHCTHLIQQLPFEHRIDISSADFDDGKLDVLCDLLEYSDFPFPRNINSHPITHDRLSKICNERKQFHEAIHSKNEAGFKAFTDNNFNNKIAFNINNQSALFKAITSKNFVDYCRLKSLGFKSEESEKCEEFEDKLTKQEKELLSRQENIQTKLNADHSMSDSKKSISLLSARSMIHNRKIGKAEEVAYRKQIIKWLEELYKIEMCKALLDAAAQCADLKIIFDFDSYSVENVDLKGKGAGGTTYTVAKYIFIAAKLKDKDREQNIKGVLIHEICHYVMKLVYENNEEPYYKSDIKSKEKFDYIVSKYNKFTAANEAIDDNCQGIISSVYTLYAQINHSAELLVRPPHILAVYDDNDDKSKELQAKYRLLFDYIADCVLPELKKFDLRHRSTVRKFNKTVGHLDDIKGDAFEFSQTKQTISNFIGSKPIIVTTNIPKLFLSDLLNNLNHQSLPDTKNIFIRPQDCENQLILRTYCQITSSNKEIRVIIDCSKGMGRNLKNLLPESNFICVVSNSNHFQAVRNTYLSKFKKSIEPHVIDYRFCDLTQDTQLYLLETDIKFQNENINLLDLMATKARSESEQSKSQAKSDTKHAQVPTEPTHVDDCFLEIVDDKLLKLLVDESVIQINAKFECEKYFSALYRQRSLVQHDNNNPELMQKLTQEELLEAVKNDKGIIISDIGGNGKSWTLKSVAMALRKQQPAKWVSYIHLKMFENVFDSKKSNSNFQQFMTEHILSSCKTFEQAIFKRLYKTGNCYVFMDGFDELTLTAMEFVKELMTSFKSNGGNQIFVTTKDNLKNELQTVLKTKVAYKPAKFIEQDAVEFIKTIWMLSDLEKEMKFQPELEVLKRLNTQDGQNYQSYAENLVSKIFNSKFLQTGLPNICKIAADIFKDKDDKSLVYSLNVEQIYGEYVKTKYQDWSSGYRRQSSSSSEDSEIFEAVNEYQAIKNVWPMLTPLCDLVYKNVKFRDEDVIACGLTSQRNDNIFFQHESFNEYFILSFIAKVIKNFKKIIRELGYEDMLTNLAIQFFSSRKFDIFRSITDNIVNDIPEAVEVKLGYLKFFGISNQNVDVVDFFAKITNKFYAAPQENENIIKLTQVVDNLLGKQKFVQKSQKFLSKFPEVSEGFNAMASKFVYRASRKLLPTNSDVKSDFHALSTLLNAESGMFAKTFDDFLDRCSHEEQSRILKECDKNQKNLLYMCIEKQKCKKLKFFWKKVEEHFKDFEDFKEVVTHESLPFNYNVFHAAVVHNKNVEFHEVFWPLAIKSFKDQRALVNALLRKDINGSNVAHLLVLENTAEVIQYLLIYLKDSLQHEIFKEFLTSKNFNGNNLIQVAIIQKYERSYLEFLWNIFVDTFDLEFIEILTETNVEKNNVFQLAARFSPTPDILKLMIDKLESNEQIKSLLRNKDCFNRNLLQSAARQNESLNCHEYLWDIVEIYLDSQEILSFINNRDSEGDNVLHSAVFNNLQEVAEFTLKKVQTFLDDDELVKYLKLRGHRHKNLKKLSLENTKDNRMVEWVGNIVGSIYSKHPYGSPTVVLTISQDQQLEVKTDQLQTILNHPDVKDRQIVVISIIGVPGKGKSFVLNYFLRYLYAHHPSINHPNQIDSNSTKWIDDDDEPLVGFTWNCPSESDESSVILWNDVFLPKFTNNDKKTAIILMDTQNCTKNGNYMFDFASLFSSNLILNLSCVPKENICEGLTREIEEITRNGSEKMQTEFKLFQNCTFLFRDWEHSNNYEIRNSQAIFDKILSSDGDQGTNIEQLKVLTESLFENLSCHMLSYPGKAVHTGTAKTSSYDGNWGEMDVDFRDEFIRFIENELKLEHLVPKKLNGKALSGSVFLKYIELQLESYKTEKYIDFCAFGDEFLNNKSSDELEVCVDDSESIESEDFCVTTNPVKVIQDAEEKHEDYSQITLTDMNSKPAQLKSDANSDCLSFDKISLKSPIDQIMEITVTSLIEEYIDLLDNKSQDSTNVLSCKDLQDECKTEIIEKYNESAKILNDENKTKFRSILSEKIEEVNKNKAEELEASVKNIEKELKEVNLKIQELENLEEKQAIKVENLKERLEVLKNQNEQEQSVTRAEKIMTLEKQSLLRIKAQKDAQICIRNELQTKMELGKSNF